MMFHNRWFCVSWAFAWQTCIRLSIFLMAILSISRTISLVYPFYKIKMKTILLPIIVYLILVASQQMIPMVAGKSFWYARRLSMCTWLLTDVVDGKSTMFKILHFIFITVEYVIPAFPIIISCIITICLLNRRHKYSTAAGALLKIEATKTIIYLTLAYIAFNTPLIIICILESIWVLSDYRITTFDLIPPTILDFIYTLIGNHAVALNSTTNVLIYFCRKEGLRKFCWKLIRCDWETLNSEEGKQAGSRVRYMGKPSMSTKNNLELSTVLTLKTSRPASPTSPPESNIQSVLQKEKPLLV